jgi:hypothetical protein
MSLEGLRAWIGEVERKLGLRTRVFLALTVIAIGISGAALYLAIDVRDDSVSKDDVQKLQQELGAAQAGTSASAPEVSRLEAEVTALQSEVEQLKSNSGSAEEKGDEAKSPDSTSGGVAPDAADNARIEELLEQAKEQTEETK